MPDLLIDLYKLKDLNSGLGQFSRQYIQHLQEVSPSDLILHGLCSTENRHLLPATCRWVSANGWRRYLPGLGRSYCLWHSLHQLPSHLPPIGTPLILTIHDLNFLVEKSPSRAVTYLRELQRHVDRATVVTAISHTTAGLVREHIDLNGKPIHTIYNGVRLEAFPDAPKPESAPEGPFFFSMGVFKEKKNFHTLLPMMAYFPQHALVLAGNSATHYGRQIRGYIQQLGLENRVFLPGVISDAEKYGYFTRCEAFLQPSEAEGFGLPPIEAMLAGKPVALNRAASLPEIGGDAGWYWDSLEPAHMAQVVQQMMAAYSEDQPNFSAKLIRHANGYSWQETIRKYLALYRTVLE